jgi:hypothetical protein
LRARITALPEFLASVRRDPRPVPDQLADDAVALVDELSQPLRDLRHGQFQRASVRPCPIDATRIGPLPNRITRGFLKNKAN